MKLFSVDVLNAVAPCERHGSFPTNEGPFGGKTLRGEDDEPFAVFGSREQQFIGIASPDKYDRYMHGVDGQSVSGVLDFSSPTNCPESTKIQKEKGRPIAKTCKNPQSPSSIFTFAALWDPDTGFTAYEKGKLLTPHKARDFAGHRPFNPSVDTSISTLLPTTHLYLPRVSKSRMRNHPIPSSTLEELADPWDFPSFDPRSLPAEFREPNSSVEFHVRFSQEGAYLSDCTDHEDFSESLGDHPDCEHHLPSRFSTTTTSTSNYVDVDFRASNPPFRGPLMTLSKNESRVLVI